MLVVWAFTANHTAQSLAVAAMYNAVRASGHTRHAAVLRSIDEAAAVANSSMRVGLFVVSTTSGGLDLPEGYLNGSATASHLVPPTSQPGLNQGTTKLLQNPTPN